MGIFDSVMLRKPKKSKFDLSHERKFSCRMGDLIPIFVNEVVPGDSFRNTSEIMMRVAPMISPIMHRVDVFTHFFFVPNRIVYDGWERFITGGVSGEETDVPPFFNYNTTVVNEGQLGRGSLADFLGLPTKEYAEPITYSLGVSALPFRAYQLICDEYYRDQNLQNPSEMTRDSGELSTGERFSIMSLRKRCWEKDYFTSALPWAQRGTEVLMPIEGEGDVTYRPISQILTNTGVDANVDTLVGTSNTFGDMYVNKANNTAAGDLGRIENIDEVTLTNTSVTINDFRRSVRLQEWLEKNAIGGARYTEQIRSHFGVTSPDARLQRPEYLGGGKQPVVISEVLSTVQDPDGEGNPQGNMSGHGISVGKTNSFSQTFTEHGFVIGIMSVLPRTAYQQGVPRLFSRFDKFDYLWPEFAHLGEQEVKVKEVYYDGATNNHNNTFGYQSRYSEYKYCPSTVHGDFKSSLSTWHMGRIFIGEPSLNSDFVTADPTTRIFPVTIDENATLYCQIFNRFSAVRPLPYFGTPML